MKNKVGIGLVVSLLLFLSVEGVAAQVLPTQARKPSIAAVKPTAVKVRACQAIEDAVTVRMESLVRLATTMREKFGAISTRTQDFYTTKVLTSGKSVANYDGLIADIASRSAAVDVELDKAVADVETFSCAAGDPKTLLTDFRIDMQAVKKALHEYRFTIRNLIVAVHTAVGEDEAEVTPTPTP